MKKSCGKLNTAYRDPYRCSDTYTPVHIKQSDQIIGSGGQRADDLCVYAYQPRGAKGHSQNELKMYV